MTRGLKRLIGVIATIYGLSMIFGAGTRTGLILQIISMGALVWLAIDGREVKASSPKRRARREFNTDFLDDCN